MNHDDVYRLDIVFYRTETHTTDGAIMRADIPSRATINSSGYDVGAYCPDGPIEIPPMHVRRINTGLVFALPQRATMLVCSRSGLASKGVQVINAPGIIDSDYRDEVGVLLTYIAPPETPPFVVTHGMRIAQLLYIPAPSISEVGRAYPYFREVQTRDSLPSIGNSTRSGGFGSTGVDRL
jgi:dUTP pyrophosphatase